MTMYIFYIILSVEFHYILELMLEEENEHIHTFRWPCCTNGYNLEKIDNFKSYISISHPVHGKGRHTLK